MPLERFDTAGEMLRFCWDQLAGAVEEGRNPLLTPAVATVVPSEAAPQVRTVILREADRAQRRISFYTDARAEKVKQLKNSPSLSWLFWHPERKLQIRARGTAELHTGDEAARLHWEAIGREGRKNYAALTAPGTPVEEASSGLPDFWSEDMPLERSEYAYKNFMLVQTYIEEIDSLLLHPQGHQRIIYRWDDGWQGGWVVA